MQYDKYDMSRSQTSAWVLRLSLILILLSALGLSLFKDSPIRHIKLSWPLSSESILNGRLWVPVSLETEPQRLRPGLLLLQGVATTQREMFVLARRLSERGYIVLSADFDTQLSLGQLEEQAQQALLQLRQQPGVDPEKIAVIGHSLGAQIAAETALKAGDVRCPVGLGMHPGTGPQPQNMAWMTGLYDILHPPGLPVKWTAVSLSANHHIETLDFGLLHALEHHLSQCLNVPPPEKNSQEQLRFVLSCLLALGFFGLLWQGLRLAPDSYALLLLYLGTTAVLLGLGYFHWLAPERVASAVVLMTAVYALKQLPERAQYMAILAPSGLWLVRDLVNLVRTIPWWISQPETLLYFPLYALQSLWYLPLLGQRLLESLLLQQPYDRIQPAWPFWALSALCLLYPQIWQTVLAKGQALWRAQRQQRSSGHAQPRLQWGILALACLALLGIGGLRLQQGFVQPELLAPVMRLVLADLLPTAGLCALGLWLYRRKKCPRDDSNVRPTV